MGSMGTRKTIVEPFKIKSVEPLNQLTLQDRERALKTAGYNLFSLPAKSVTFDFLTDSGTTAMSAAQWAGMLVADEAYAGSTSFDRFRRVVERLTSCPHVIPTHQGRAAERLLCQLLVKPGSKIPSNNHFDTTRANIEYMGGEAVDLVTPEAIDPANTHPFKGNVDIDALKSFLLQHSADVPFGMVTITNNSGGGQPVSLQNLRAVAELYKEFDVPFIIDACRFAENAFFIKEREFGYENAEIRTIVSEIFDLCDGCYMSAKKDALVNIGGFIALKNQNWVEEIRTLLILTEGFPTYGGLAARDLEAMAIGLEEVLDESYLRYRVAMTRYMADGLRSLGFPLVEPPGGHAVYIDAKQFLPHIPPNEFPGQALACELYRLEGIRSCEIGSVMFGKRKGESFIPAKLELLRLAFPRRVYTQSHFDYILEGLESLAKTKETLRGLKLTYEPPYLRHFTAQFSPL